MTYNAELTRKGPGLLVRDLARFEDPVLRATLQRIVGLAPDVLALQSVDYDHSGVGLSLVQQRLAELGWDMPFSFAAPPNTGVPTGFDLDRDGRLDTASDRQGYGEFQGQGGMALLSRYPLVTEDAQDFTDLLWRELPGAVMPASYYSTLEQEVLRLFNVGAWDVPVALPGGTVRVLVVQTSPPVFDGPEDRNGLRNADQIRFLTTHLGNMGDRFVLMGGLNNDPHDGEGVSPPLLALLESRLVQDVQPVAKIYSEDPAHLGPADQDTVDWPGDIGSLRVDYILPSASWGVAASAVERDAPAGQSGDGPLHKPVWVDLFWQ